MGVVFDSAGGRRLNYRAYIENKYMSRGVRVLLFQDAGIGHVDCLMANGTWERVPEGAEPAGEMGVTIPAAALPQIHDAIAAHLGNSVPTKAEVSVLREWLAVERGRVDKTLGAPS